MDANGRKRPSSGTGDGTGPLDAKAQAAWRYLLEQECVPAHRRELRDVLNKLEQRGVDLERVVDALWKARVLDFYDRERKGRRNRLIALAEKREQVRAKLLEAAGAALIFYQDFVPKSSPNFPIYLLCRKLLDSLKRDYLEFFKMKLAKDPGAFEQGDAVDLWPDPLYIHNTGLFTEAHHRRAGKTGTRSQPHRRAELEPELQATGVRLAEIRVLKRSLLPTLKRSLLP